MNKIINQLKISTPGRVCLFGEHQDYLHLPVVAAAISLRISITGSRRDDKIININLPNISHHESFNIAEPIVYTEERDYFKSSLKVLLRNLFTFSSGFDCIVDGKIPINAGTSSSSALIVTWINFLTRMSDQSVLLSPEHLARYAYEAEVLEFSEPGGMMDHYSTSFGGIISIDFFPKTVVTKLEAKLKAFVLGNSHQPKDTKHILSNVKERILFIEIKLKNVDSKFSIQDISFNELFKFKNNLSDSEFILLEGTIKNRDITRIARTKLNKKDIDHKLIGTLLNDHQKVLRDVLGISTPKIDGMIEAALNAGAYGAKINGSGGGGCMFAYAPENPRQVYEAISKISDEVYIIYPDEGTREEAFENV